jgi:5-dehydro-2-deoxygluconokinase
MLNSACVYMLAADHRWQWEEWCEARSIPRPRISEVKQLAADGFRLARNRSPRVREFGALLLDEQYASAVIEDARRDGLVVGTPAEKAGAFPLAWSMEPFERALTGSFVKVLVRFRSDDADDIREGQWQKLETLQAWCHRAGKPLVVEVLVPRRQEPEDTFDAEGRPAMLADFIREAYGRGLTPEFWKIEGTAAPEGARAIDRAIAAQPQCRQIILGKAADIATIERWFAAAYESATAAGFAIGRTVFWEPSTAFLVGSSTASEAAAHICANYLRLVSAWRR